jgi:hypothetical protein
LLPPLFSCTVSNDHFQVFGNRRFNAIAYDHGYVEMHSADRTLSFLNWVDPVHYGEKDQNYGGGFSYISSTNVAPFCSAYLHAPQPADPEQLSPIEYLQLDRTFGMGYYDQSIVDPASEVKVSHSIFAPFGDHPFLIDEVTLENTNVEGVELDHYEYWDVNIVQLLFQFFRAGEILTPLSDQERRDFMSNFTQTVVREDNGIPLLVIETIVKPEVADVPAPDGISRFDFHMNPVFLAFLPTEGSQGLGVDDVFVDQATFFGEGGVRSPDAVRNDDGDASASSGDLKVGERQDFDAFEQPAMLGMKTSGISLAGGESVTLRFAYGYYPQDIAQESSIIDMLRDFTTAGTDEVENLADTVEEWAKHVTSLSFPPGTSNPMMEEMDLLALAQEARWHTYSLQMHSIYSNYYDEHVVPQGSIYLYNIGFDGAPRDHMHILAPLALHDMELSESTLRMTMQTRDRNSGTQSYAFTGYGCIDKDCGLDLGLRCDLDVEFMFGILEYLSYSGDDSFWNLDTDYHPKHLRDSLPPGANGHSTLDHVRAAFEHLEHTVGVGENDVLRMHHGDWNDGLLFVESNPSAFRNNIEFGESMPATQMAYYVLPRMAIVVEPLDAPLAERMRAFATKLYAGMTSPAMFGGKWFSRAFLRDSENVGYAIATDDAVSGNRNYLDLESQLWPLVDQDDALTTGVKDGLERSLTPEQRDFLYGEIENTLETPLGPLLGSLNLQSDLPGFLPYYKTLWLQWAAQTQLLTWAYAKESDNRHIDKAWDLLRRTSQHNHMQLYPQVWMGTISSPDAFALDGDAWAVQGVSMNDMPIANMNMHGMWLRSLYYILGVEPSGNGINLDMSRPVAASMPYDLSTPLLDVALVISDDASSLTGSYRPAMTAGGALRMSVRLPSNSSVLVCRIQGVEVPCGDDAEYMRFDVPFSGRDIPFKIEWR